MSTKLYVNKMSFDEKLIDEVEKFQIIYNKKAKEYRNNTLREKAWKEISNNLNADVEACKGRWRNLRDTFCKKLGQLPSGSGSDMKENMEWVYFKRLLFLKDFVKSRQTTGNFDQWTFENVTEDCTFSPPMMESNLNKDVTLDLQNTSQTTDLPSTSTSTPVLNKKRKKVPDEADESFSKFLKTMVILAEKRFGENDSGDNGFCKLLMSKLGRLPEKIKEETKMEILNLVHNKIAQHSE